MSPNSTRQTALIVAGLAVAMAAMHWREHAVMLIVVGALLIGVGYIDYTRQPRR